MTSSTARIPKFPAVTAPLHATLKSRVDAYFADSALRTRGDWRLYVKAFTFIGGLIALYTHLVFFTPVWYLAWMESAIAGLCITGIGFNVMHDGSHDSFSSHRSMNWLASTTLECLGGSSYMWKMKHCMLHHSFTNVEGFDDDIDLGKLMCVNEHQTRYSAHRFQHLYFWFLYSMVYLTWIFQMDYTKYFTGKIASVHIPRMRRKDHIKFWAGKALHILLFIAIPVYFVGFLPWLAGFLTMTMTAGFALSIVFQLAHTVEVTDFPVPALDTLALPDEFAIHQIATTANFAPRSAVVTWLVGGLNFQIEHHLFPRVSHVHYPAIGRIVKQVCLERNIPYLEHPTLFAAIRAHVRHLRILGRAPAPLPVPAEPIELLSPPPTPDFAAL